MLLISGPEELVVATNQAPEPRGNDAVTVRLAVESDAADISRIHNQGIASRLATFETVPRTTAAIRGSLLAADDRHATIVVEKNGVVAAWASVSAYRSRACYAGVGEHSVYVDDRYQKQGLGLIALNALIAASRERGFWKLVSRIFPENIASLRLHERAGFRVVGTYHQHARLDGEWRDCVIVERLISST